MVNLHDGARRVSLFRDSALSYPDLYMEVFIAGPAFEQKAFAEMLVRSSCTKADSPDKADLVIFTGGEDVDPALYGELPHNTTRINPKRDMADIELYKECLEKGIPMLGICRGAQFLAVMNGAKLYQDVDNHYGDHSIYDHKGKRTVGKVSSVHHQMVIPHPDGGMEIIATSGEARNRWKNPQDKIASGSMQDVEAFFYRETMCLGIQGHPEYRGYNGFAKWTLDLINDVIICSPDTTLINNKRRLDPDLLAQREQNWKMTVKKEAVN